MPYPGGLLDGLFQRHPGLLQDPRFASLTGTGGQPAAVQPPAAPAARPGGGVRGAIGRVLGGQDDPRLSEEQNAAARKQAIMQAGLGILASDRSGIAGIAEGALYGQQAGAGAREMIYGRTQEERLQQALQDPTVTGKLTPQQLAHIRLLPPGEAMRLLAQLAFAPKPEPKVVSEGGALVDDTGRELYARTKAPDLPADLRAAFWEMGLDAETLTPEQRAAAMKRYEELKRAGSTTVNVGGPAQQDFLNTNALSTQFRADVRDHQVVADNYGNVLASASNPSPAGDMALIFSFMKMLDPGSTVREGEYANARNAASIPERIRAQYNKAMDGQELTPPMRADFVDRARGIAEQRQRQIKPILERYRRRALDGGFDPNNVIYDPFAEIGSAGPAVDPFADLKPRP